MVVYVWTALLMMFYAANLPFCLVIDADIRREDPVRVGLGVFLPPKHLRPPGARRASGGSKLPRGPLLHSFFYLLRRTRFRGEASLCLGDAATTALVSGAVMALTLGRVRVHPDFSTGPIAARFRGMVYVKTGHIMLAALNWAQEEISGRVNLWRRTRLRAL
jgi:hypothetical protein